MVETSRCVLILPSLYSHVDATPSERCPAFEFLSLPSTAHRMHQWLQLISCQWLELPHLSNASDVSDVVPDRLADSPSMAAPVSQSTWKDARYSLFIVRIEVKSSPVVGMISSAQIIGSLLVRRNIDGANLGPLTCLVLQGPPFGYLFFRPDRSTAESGRGSYLDAWWCSITSGCVNGRRIYCSTTAW
jgi:hypothetical protein